MLEELKEQYDKLCAERDATNAEVAPLMEQLAVINSQIEVLRVQAEAKKLEIDNIRGGMKWIELKKAIATLAKALSRPI